MTAALSRIVLEEAIDKLTKDLKTASDERCERAFGEFTDGTGQGPDTQLELWRRIHDLAGRDPEAIKKIADREIQKREAELLDLWEILVPVANNEVALFPEDHHESFRRILRGLPGNNGTTTRPAGDGDWEDRDSGKVYAERMIPIRFRACRADAERMATHARKFYDQIEVIAYRIAPGNDVIIARAEG